MFRMFRNKKYLVPLTIAALSAMALVGEASAKDPLHFQTGGYGVFSPANLGVGDPATHPTVVGDGSGISVYNGTPTGNEFRLNGQLVGDGWDQHFGAAQSFTPGIVGGPTIIFYPYKTTNNPIRPGRKIHIMKSRAGEIWFQYEGFFTLDLADGTLISRSDFRIVGGTRMFANATGDVFVVTRTDLADITADGAPFRYDFDGFIRLHH